MLAFIYSRNTAVCFSFKRNSNSSANLSFMLSTISCSLSLIDDFRDENNKKVNNPVNANPHAGTRRFHNIVNMLFFLFFTGYIINILLSLLFFKQRIKSFE